MDPPFVDLHDFMTETERAELQSHALSLLNKGALHANHYGDQRFFAKIWETDMVTPTINSIAARIEQQFVLDGCPIDPDLGWIISVQLEGAFVHPHRDARAYTGKRKHLRCNLLVTKPESGGIPLIEMQPVKLVERGGWAFLASESDHCSTPVRGTTPRIVYQFGYSVPEDWLPPALGDLTSTEKNEH